MPVSTYSMALDQTEVVCDEPVRSASSLISKPLFNAASAACVSFRFSIIRLPRILKLARRTGVNMVASVLDVGTVTKMTRFDTLRAVKRHKNVSVI